MNRGDQGPILLAVAGTLLLLAVVAYAISDADGVFQRREAQRRTGEAFREQAKQLSEDRKVLNAEIDRLSKQGSDFRIRQEAILESLKRLERTTSGFAAKSIEDL